jgi:fructosamine-3-kinase
MTTTDAAIAQALGSQPVATVRVAGGSIHESRRLDLEDGRRVFLKLATGGKAPLLAAEARGLALLEPHLRTPRRIAAGEMEDGGCWLALEWLELRPLDAAGWHDLGRGLAALHSVEAARHGLGHDNFIGTTAQDNTPADGWAEFFIERRLRPQLRLARGDGHQLPEPELIRLAEKRLAGHEPAPALLHGDLWTGNVAGLAGAGAVVFDPAPYHGDPETDLAMLELFGGPLPAEFVRGYGGTSPGRRRRRPLYDLYHALNHLNLFGPGYNGMVKRCLDELRHA